MEEPSCRKLEPSPWRDRKSWHQYEYLYPQLTYCMKFAPDLQEKFASLYSICIMCNEIPVGPSVRVNDLHTHKSHTKWWDSQPLGTVVQLWQELYVVVLYFAGSGCRRHIHHLNTRVLLLPRKHGVIHTCKFRGMARPLGPAPALGFICPCHRCIDPETGMNGTSLFTLLLKEVERWIK